MKIDIEERDDHQVDIKARVDGQLIVQAKRRAAKRLSRQTKVPGFRPGKAPYAVVERIVGEAALLEEALDLLIDDLYPRVIEESEVRPYGPGSLEDFDLEAAEPTFQFRVPLAPEVELGDYQTIRVPYEPVTVSDEDVQESLEQIRENQALIEPVDRPAEEGDVVFIKIDGEQVDPQEGEEALVIRERHLNVLILSEEGEEDEWPYPGFSRALIGTQAGQELDLDFTFGDEHYVENLQNTTVTFHVLVEEVKSRTLPAVDDDFAQSVGEYESLAELQDHIRKLLQERADEDYLSEYNNQILELVQAQATIKFPPQMLEREIHEVRHGLENRLAQQGLDLDIYMKSQELDEEGLDAELTPTAEERIQRGLILMEVAEREGIEVDPEEVQDEASRTIDQLYQILPRHQVRKRLSGGMIQDMVGQIMGEKMSAKAMERLRDIARGQADGDEESDAEPSLPEEETPESAADTPSAEPLEGVPEAAHSASDETPA